MAMEGERENWKFNWNFDQAKLGQLSHTTSTGDEIMQIMQDPMIFVCLNHRENRANQRSCQPLSADG